MELALVQADLAAEAGDVPVGCVLVGGDGLLVATGRNLREVLQDPTAHAEIVALRAAAVQRGHWRLDGVTLYVTLEPCPMCAGALVNARVSRLVYGASDHKAGAVDTHFGIGRTAQLNHRFEVSSGILKEDCVARLRSFFGNLRAEGQK